MPHFRRPPIVASSRPLRGLILCGVITQAVVAGVAAAQSATPSGAERGTSAENQQRLTEIANRVESEYIIGPKAAGELGYRVLWQTTLSQPAGVKLTRAGVRGDMIFAGDSRNRVARLRATDGEQMWRVAVANPVDIFRGIHAVMVPFSITSGGVTKLASEERVFITTDTECFVLTADSGSILSRQRFAKLPSTPPVFAGRFLIYGTRGGQVVWHQFIVGEEWRANSLSGTIRANLVTAPGVVIATSSHGDVMCLDDESAARRWLRATFDSIEATPAVGANEVFVASTDQYLWAFDLRTGAVLWKHFTESPLKTPPFALNNTVLQYIPGRGLVCFSARSAKIDGEVRWSNKDVVGVPIGAIGNRIALWDVERHVLTLVDAERGSLVSTATYPQVNQLQLINDGAFAGDIVALCEDGRVVRLTPKVAVTKIGAMDEMPAAVGKAAP